MNGIVLKFKENHYFCVYVYLHTSTDVGDFTDYADD